MRVTTSDNGITNAIEIYRPASGQVWRPAAAAAMPAGAAGHNMFQLGCGVLSSCLVEGRQAARSLVAAAEKSAAATVNSASFASAACCLLLDAAACHPLPRCA
jgi:hypothetical protein